MLFLFEPPVNKGFSNKKGVSDLTLPSVMKEAIDMKAIARKFYIIMALVCVITFAGAPVVGYAAEDGTYYMKWEEYVEENGIKSWNWNDAANAIDIIINHAIDLYEKGENDEAYTYAKATYWGYYETTGFERNVMTYISGARVSSVELSFTNFRKSIKKDLGIDTVKEEGANLSKMLHEDAAVLSPEGSVMDVASGSSSGGALATFLGSFFIIVREGLEAILIVGAIIAYLVKTGNKQGVVPVYIGSVLAIVCSFIMAGILSWAKAVNPETAMSQEIIEGIAALLAVAVLFYVSNWMISKAESKAWEGYIEGKAASGISEREPRLSCSISRCSRRSTPVRCGWDL